MTTQTPARSENPTFEAENARRGLLYDPIRLKTESDLALEKESRERYLAINPEYRTKVDNNPTKVMVYVNKTSHFLPIGPFTVKYLKNLLRLPGIGLSMNGHSLDNDAEQISLNGGEVFISDDFHFDYFSNPADPWPFYLVPRSTPADPRAGRAVPDQQVASHAPKSH